MRAAPSPRPTTRRLSRRPASRRYSCRTISRSRQSAAPSAACISSCRPPRRQSWSGCCRAASIDVAVDLRVGSPTYGRWHGRDADGGRRRAIVRAARLRTCLLHAGTGHAWSRYKVDEFYAPASDSGLIWNDPDARDRLAGRRGRRGVCRTRTSSSAASRTLFRRSGTKATDVQAHSGHRRRRLHRLGGGPPHHPRDARIRCWSSTSSPMRAISIRLRPCRTIRAMPSCAPTSATPRRCASCSTNYRPDAVMHLAAESHVDRSIDGPGEFIQTNVVGTFSLLQAALGYWRALAGRAGDGFPLPSHLDRRGVRLARRGGLVQRDDRLRSALALFGLEGIVRSSGARLASHLRPAGRADQLLEQLRAVSFPRKAHPADDHQCARRPKLPVYGEGANVRDWLYVDDHARALLAVVTEGAPGETYCIGGRCEKTNLDVVETICALMDELAPNAKIGPRKALIAFRGRPARSRPALRDRRLQDQTDLGWEPRETFDPACARPSNGISTTAPGGSASAAASIAASGWELSRDPAVRRRWPARPRAEARLRGARGAAGRALPRAGRHHRSRRRCAMRSRGITRPSVINAAAYTKVDLAETEAEAAHRANAIGPAFSRRLAPRQAFR